MAVRLSLLILATVAMALVYMILGFEARNERVFYYILNLRLETLQALVLVGAAIGASSMAFMALAQNRILTPSILGFDALFILLQTALIFSFGSAVYSRLPAIPLFLGEVALLSGLTALLIWLVLRVLKADLQLLLLVGLVFALLFRSGTFFLQRLIDPTEFAVVQDVGFASFVGLDLENIVLSWALLGLGLLGLFALAPRLNVMTLGRATALSLGERFDRLQILIMLLIAALIAVATALVGPIAFLGLIVAHLTFALFPTHRHEVLLPAAALMGVLVLLVSQTALQRVLEWGLNIGILIEATGGLLLLILIFRRKSQ